MEVIKKDELNDEEILNWTCQFKSPELEQTYIETKLEHHKKISQFLAAVIAIVLTLIVFSDQLIIKSEYWPHPALEWRAALVFSCVLAIFTVPYFKTVKHFKILLFSFVILFLVNLQLMVFTYKDHYVLHVFFDVIILIVIYASTLFSFKASCVIGLSYAAVGSILIISTKSIGPHTSGMVLVAYLAANLVGVVISNQEHTLRRSLFLRKQQLKDIALEMKSYAFKDSLTNIPNRRAFDDRYDNFVRTAARLSKSTKHVCVAVSDIDFFKRVNDTYGHDVGDTVLIKFSQFLADSIRPTDAVFRFGGEEFVIILIDCSKEDAINVINNIINKLNTNILNIKEINTPITASFGLAFMQSDDSARAVISRADKVLYQAKDNGRNQLCIDTDTQ